MVQTASIIMHYHAGAWERENIKRLTESAVRVYASGIAGIPVIGFSRLNQYGGHATSRLKGGFFVSKHPRSLHGEPDGEASACWFPLLISRLTPFGLPPVFSRSVGRYNYQYGASL